MGRLERRSVREHELPADLAAGVRSNVLDQEGNSLKEAVGFSGPQSYHIVHDNSPGATDPPAFSAWVVKNLVWKGHLDHRKKKAAPLTKPWGFDAVVKSVDSPDR